MSNSNYPAAPAARAVHNHVPPASFSQNGSAGVAPVPDSYFTETRKGEVNELVSACHVMMVATQIV
jgi:hypothetical protein